MFINVYPGKLHILLCVYARVRVKVCVLVDVSVYIYMNVFICMLMYICYCDVVQWLEILSG